MNIAALLTSLCIVTTAYGGQFLELAANTADPNPGLPPGVPKEAVSRQGSVYLNLGTIQKIYYDHKAMTCEIWAGDSVFYVKFVNEDARTIFRSFIAGSEYRAGEGLKEATKSAAVKSGFVPVEYVFERTTAQNVKKD